MVRRRRAWFGWLVLCVVMGLGCALDGVGSGGVTVSGTVQGEVFDGASGVADVDASGSYLITLADDVGFTCNDTPFTSYLTVALPAFMVAGTYPAAGSVTFTQVDEAGGAASSETASSGSITITEIDEEFGSI